MMMGSMHTLIRGKQVEWDIWGRSTKKEEAQWKR